VVKGPNQTNVDTLNSVRHEASRHFRNKKKEYLKPKIDELETNSEIKIISCGIVARWRDHFSQLLNVHGFNDIRQTEIHTAKLLVPEPSAIGFEIAVGKLKRHKLPGIDQIPAELIKAEVGQFILRSISLLILFGVRRNGRSRSFTHM
jgi:hypothetical protein